jgi:hypothetical protein
MRYPEAHAGRSGSVPLMLRGPKSARMVVSAAVAGLIGLAPAVMVSSPALAGPDDPKYQLSASSTPVLETAGSKVVDKETVPVQKKVVITARLTAAAPSGGAEIPVVTGSLDDGNAQTPDDGNTAVPGDPNDDPEKLRDYDQLTEENNKIKIAAGKTSGTISVTLYDDPLDEADTQFFTIKKDPEREAVGVSDAVSGAGVAKVTIQDDDATPTVSIEDADATDEGNSLLFPLTLSGPSERDVTVKATTANGVTSGDNYGATAPGDYYALTGESVTIPKTSTSALLQVVTKTDSVVEATPETLSVSIANPAYANLGTPTTATGGINDAGPAPTFTVSTNKDEASTSFSPEGNSGEAAAYVYLTLSDTSSIPVRLNYTFGGSYDTATSGVDYKGTAGSLTIAPGEKTAKIPVSIVGDKVYEKDGETFGIVFTSPNGSVAKSSLGDDNATALTITDDDDAPKYSIADYSIKEGNTGVTTAKMPVTLSGPSNADTTFTVTLTADTATLGGENTGVTVGADDYDEPDGTVTIPAGSTSANIEIPINADTIFEHDDTVNVAIAEQVMSSGGSGSSLPQVISVTTDWSSAHEAVLTILNDDDPPTIKFNETSGSEGTFLRLSAELVGQSEYDIPISMTFGGNPGDTATKGTDYSFQMGDMDSDTDTAPMTITRGQAPGPLWNSAMALVYLDPDNIDEPTETASILVKEVVDGTPVGFKQTSGVYKINDDPGDLPPSAAVGDAAVMGNAGTVSIPVNLAFTSDATSTTQTVTVPYWTVDGTAKAGSDYTAKTGTLTFAPGELTKNVIVPIMNKSRSMNRAFYVKLGSPGPAGASVTDGSGAVTIQSGEGGGTGGTGTTMTTPARVSGGAAVPIKGKAEPGATVELWGAPWGDDSELKRIGTTKADSNGNYSFSRWIGSGYRFKTRCNGAESDEKKVQVEQDPTFVVGPPSRGSVNLTVQSDPKDPGQPVIIQRLDRGKWVNTNWKGTTNSNGQWKGSIKPGRGSWQLRAFVQGYTPDGLLPGYSDGKKVTIK